MSKFQGDDGDIKYREWKEQVKGMFSVQGDLTEPAKVSLVMDALSGLA